MLPAPLVMTARPMPSSRDLRRGRESGHRIRTIRTIIAALLAVLASAAHAPRIETLDGWPWQITLLDAVVVVYQPHIDAWKHDRLAFCAAVTVRATDSDDEVFGVVWGAARTTADRVAGRVTLSEIRLNRSSFPALSDNGRHHFRELRKRLKGVMAAVALERLEESFVESHQNRTPGRARYLVRSRDPGGGSI
jgi:hypothetical protein